MPVSSLLERMRKKLQEKTAAASSGGNKSDTNGNGTGEDDGPSNAATSPSTSTSHRVEPAVPLPPPVFASPSSAHLDYRDPVNDPLCVPFTSDMVVPILEQLLRDPLPSAPLQIGTSGSAEASTTAVKPSNAAVEEAKDSTAAATHARSGPTTQSSNVVVEKAVRHLREFLGAASLLNKAEHPLSHDTTAENITPQQMAALDAPQATTPIPASLYDDVDYQSACALSRVDVSGDVRPMCRDVNAYTRVGRISQGVYGVVFKAVASAALHSNSNNEEENTEKTSSSTSSSSLLRKSYALKHIKKMWLEESQIGFPPYLLREIDLLLRLQHPNVMGARELVLLDPAPLPRPLQTPFLSAAVSSSSRRHPRDDDDGGEATAHDHVDAAASSLPHPPPQQRTASQTTATAAGSPNGAEASAAVRPLAAVGAVSETKDVFLVMDFCPFDLTTYMRRYHTTSAGQIPYFHITTRNAHHDAAANYVARAKSIAYQLFRAVAFLHANRVMHRDLKTSNVLLDENGVVKVCDFGLGRLYREGQGLTPTVVTLMYRAPELHLGVADYSHKMDVWSLGCILAELFLRRPLFHASTDIHHLLAVCDVIGIPTEETFPGLYHLPQTKVMIQSLPRWNRASRLAELFQPGATLPTPSHGETPVAAESALLPPAGLDLLRVILQWNPRRRPSAEEVLQHPFFHTDPLPCAPAELMRPMPWKSAEQPSVVGETAAQLRPPPSPVTVAVGATTTKALPSTIPSLQQASLPTPGGAAQLEANEVGPTGTGIVAAPLPIRAATLEGRNETNLVESADRPGRGLVEMKRPSSDDHGDAEADHEVRLAQMRSNLDTDDLEDAS